MLSMSIKVSFINKNGGVGRRTSRTIVLPPRCPFPYDRDRNFSAPGVLIKVREREGAFIGTRGACAPQKNKSPALD
jgi:hypothetical protein